MITHTEIKLGEYLGTFELFEQLVDVGKWVFVLDSLLVQWTVVNTKSVRSILLLHKKNTRTPRRGTRSDETHSLLNIELLLQLLQLFRSELVSVGERSNNSKFSYVSPRSISELPSTTGEERNL